MPLAILVCALPALFIARVYYFVNMKRFLKYPLNFPLIVADIPTETKRDLITRSTVWRVLYAVALAGSTVAADKIIAAKFGSLQLTFFPWVFLLLTFTANAALNMKASIYWTGNRVCEELSSRTGNDWQRDSVRLCQMGASDCIVNVVAVMLTVTGILSFLNLAAFPERFSDPPAGFGDNEIVFVYALVAFQIPLLIGTRVISRYPEFLVVSQIGKLNSKRRERFRSSPYDPLGVVREEIFVLARYVEQASAKLERSISKDATFAPSVVLRAGAADLLGFLASRDSLDNIKMPKRVKRNSEYLLALMIDAPSRAFYDQVAYEWKAFDEHGRPAQQSAPCAETNRGFPLKVRSTRRGVFTIHDPRESRPNGRSSCTLREG
ncbi:hypothetical protein GCM10027614_57260 [Micromonospora vulcania]